MALEDICKSSNLQWSSFKYFYIDIYKKKKLDFLFYKIKVSKIYSVFFSFFFYFSPQSDIHSHHSLRGMLADIHILHNIQCKAGGDMCV